LADDVDVGMFLEVILRWFYVRLNYFLCETFVGDVT